MNPRLVPAEQLLESFGWEIEHARKVRDLALAMFDQLQPLHQLREAERDILEAAALLHDIGWTVAGQKHHKHSAELIRMNAAKLVGFDPAEVEMIALVARYHRKSEPCAEHEDYMAQPEQAEHSETPRVRAANRNTVCKLASLLRLADGFDRPHLQWVSGLHCEITERHVMIRVHATAEAGLHIEGASRKCSLFEAVFKRPVEFAVLT
jgi:exopolyphosphatase/guanosine-5'-triphosphate,3'-diphosphate pyrophosphatase